MNAIAETTKIGYYVTKTRCCIFDNPNDCKINILSELHRIFFTTTAYSKNTLLLRLAILNIQYLIFPKLSDCDENPRSMSRVQDHRVLWWNLTTTYFKVHESRYTIILSLILNPWKLNIVEYDCQIIHYHFRRIYGISNEYSPDIDFLIWKWMASWFQNIITKLLFDIYFAT